MAMKLYFRDMEGYLFMGQGQILYFFVFLTPHIARLCRRIGAEVIIAHCMVKYC